MNTETKRVRQPRRTYARVQRELGEVIAQHDSLTKLPSEPELAETLHVSRATLREVLRIYESRGLIRRQQGVGTFVVSTPQVLESGIEVLESVESLAKRQGVNVTMRGLSVSERAANETEATMFALDPGASLLEVRRVMVNEARPIAYLVDVLPEGVLGADELDHGFTGSVLDLLLRRGKPRLTQSTAEIQAVPAPMEITRALQVQRDSVLLTFDAKLYAEGDRLVDLSQSYFLPGYFRFHVVRRVGEAVS